MEKFLNSLRIRLFAVVLAGLSTCLFGIEQQALAQQCGAGAQQDIMLLLDLSGSQSQASIASQKANAREFLLSFTHPSQKPRVGIVTYNSNCDCGEISGSPTYDACGAGEVNCYHSGFNHARVVVALSNNYTTHLAQLASGSGILGAGPGGSGYGGSNVKEALTVAQQHLVSNGSGWSNNIVFLSDGHPTLPGYFLYPLSSCNNCNCDPAELEGQNAALNVRASGTRIFTGFTEGEDDVIDTCPLNVPGCPTCSQIPAPASCYQCLDNQAIAFLRDAISSTPPANNFFSNPNACFDGVFSQLGYSIGCSDGQSCTTDNCNETSGSCSFIATDSDGDGVNDCIDTCVGNNSLINQPCDGSDPDSCNGGTYSCSTGTLVCSDSPALDDSDGDGVPNCQDNCVGNNSLINQPCDGSDPDSCNGGTYSCSTGTLVCSDSPALDDSDGDGISNCQDNCVGNNSLINQPCDGSDPDSCNGGTYSCSTGTLLCSDSPSLDDSDGDGVANCVDGCPTDGGKTTPGVCGCGVSDADTDGDGTPNCNDGCPSDPTKTTPGVCGCGTPDSDPDGDGQVTCNDQCPDDPNKGAPGLCGCGLPDTDTDADGTPDCFDNCDTDPSKIEVGICGCGTSDGDSNGNGITDCLEPTTNVVVQCTQVDVQGYIEALENVIVGQEGQLDRLLRDLRLKREICPNAELVMAQVRTSQKRATRLFKQNVTQLEQLPAAALECEESLSCTATPIPVDEPAYLKRSKTLRVLTLRAIDTALSCRSGPGVCEGTLEGCRERAILRQEQAAKERRLAKRWHRRNALNIKGVPRTTDKCV